VREEACEDRALVCKSNVASAICAGEQGSGRSTMDWITDEAILRGKNRGR
jgi:hypothetical protein